MEMGISLGRAASDLGSSTVNTPFLNVAPIFSELTAVGSVNARWNLP